MIRMITFLWLSLAVVHPVHACMAPPPDPQEDAQRAESIFVGRVIYVRRAPPTGEVVQRSLVEVATIERLKGVAPDSAIVEPVMCGSSPHPGPGGHVIVFRSGKSMWFREVGGEYERGLRAVLERAASKRAVSKQASTH